MEKEERFEKLKEEREERRRDKKEQERQNREDDRRRKDLLAAEVKTRMDRNEERIEKKEIN